MNFHYSAEPNVLMVLALFKEYGIKQVIASPGAINIPVVASMQQDPYFEMKSCVDERSAAYMACGWAEETGEPVVLSCTGATSSRNYMPGLTEAFYRKLPVIALTSSRDASRIGHLMPQVTDRMAHPNDIVVDFAHIQTIKDKQDEWDANIKLNRALNNLRKGPVHINITDAVSRSYDVIELPKAKVIKRILPKDIFPTLPSGRIAIFCGEHKAWTKEETDAIDAFCACNDAVVIVDHTSKYHGKYRVLYSLIGAQHDYEPAIPQLRLVIHIGEVSGAYHAFGAVHGYANKVWRVNPDGEFRDFFKKLSCVFQMDEVDFFKHYTKDNYQPQTGLFDIYKKEFDELTESMPDIPFSNLFLGQKLGMAFPDNSILYLGILNTLRMWSFTEIKSTVKTYSNVGGFGIDGTLSSAIGSTYANPEKLTFVVLGDLSFFYDMNSIGNHCLKNNLRVLMVNNGKGIEFRHLDHQAAFMGDDADDFVAAAGHWGRQSRDLVRHFAQDLGFTYLSASNKVEFEKVYKEFVNPEITEKPIFLEVFTTTEEEQQSLQMIYHVKSNMRRQIKNAIKNITGGKVISAIKKITS